LQEDGRFDEVGPAGEVLWCLHRLEPQSVQETPEYLVYRGSEANRSTLNEQMINLEQQLNDELSEVEQHDQENQQEVVISLIYPHLRAGTLPLSSRVQPLFPTAHESPRVRFTLIDGKSGKKFQGWVVREAKYVYGLSEWYKENGLIPGSLVVIRKGGNPGEVIVEAKTHRSTKDWLRTAMIGADGGVVFAMLKQTVGCEFNDRMAFAIPAVSVVDQAWVKEANRPFEQTVINMIREVSKLNPQGHVHAQELYSAINIVRRVPPAPLFAVLSANPQISHVGDLHFRINE
jgi:hypothetical protein